MFMVLISLLLRLSPDGEKKAAEIAMQLFKNETGLEEKGLGPGWTPSQKSSAGDALAPAQINFVRAVQQIFSSGWFSVRKSRKIHGVNRRPRHLTHAVPTELRPTWPARLVSNNTWFQEPVIKFVWVGRSVLMKIRN
jgi:hypothetical protein